MTFLQTRPVTFSPAAQSPADRRTAWPRLVRNALARLLRSRTREQIGEQVTERQLDDLGISRADARRAGLHPVPERARDSAARAALRKAFW